MKHSLTLLCVLLTAVLIAQARSERQAENWHFGKGISLSFVDGNPVLTPPSAMDAFEGVVSQSDSLGNLLFYTNGGGRPPGSGQSPGIIWNRNHEVMYDMRGAEGGGFSARQSSIAVPDPGGRPGIYYLFTMDEQEFNIGGSIPGQPQGRGLSYFLIDMNGNGGLGEVVDYRERLVIAYEALDATPMADGTGYWIICHDNNASGNGRLFVIPLTAAGAGAPQTIPLPFPTTGRLKFSPNGNFLYFNGRLLAFDNTSGDVGNTLNRFDNASTAACFTPDSRYLYYTEGRPALGTVIVRYDLTDFVKIDVARLADNNTDAILLSAGFQLGPDGNIYFVEERFAGQQRDYGLSRLLCVSSPTPSVERYFIDLTPFGMSADGFRPQYLPQYVDAIFQEPVVEDTLTLDTLTLMACDEDSLILHPREFGTAFSWSDGSVLDSLQITTGGTYCVTITGGCQPTVDCQTVNYFSTAAEIEIRPLEAVGCEELTYLLAITQELPLDSARVTYTGSASATPYRTLSLSANSLVLSRPRNFTDDQVDLILFTSCGATSFPLDFSGFSDDRFRPELLVEATEELCNGLSFSLTVINPGALAIERVRWVDGNTDNPRSFIANTDSLFLYQTTAFSECGDSVELAFTEPIAEFCNCRAQIPELVTPNGDGTNDVFRVFSNCPPEDFQVIVFNRWGQEVFASSDPDQGWDGTKNGSPQNQDVYLYRMVFRLPGIEEMQTREGQFSLVR